jgi:hypothetical protein
MRCGGEYPNPQPLSPPRRQSAICRVRPAGKGSQNGQTFSPFPAEATQQLLRVFRRGEGGQGVRELAS